MRDIHNKYKVNIDSSNCKYYKFEKCYVYVIAYTAVIE